MINSYFLGSNIMMNGHYMNEKGTRDSNIFINRLCLDAPISSGIASATFLREAWRVDRFRFNWVNLKW